MISDLLFILDDDVMTQKNKDADSTNPNLYSIIDEHVYDEIKHKEGYRDPGKNYFIILTITLN